MKKKLFAALILMLPVVLFLYGQLFINTVSGKERIVTAKPGDNAADLQRLLDYNKYDTYQLTVQIPAGTYILNKELRIYSNTSIIADPKAILLKNHLKGGILANDLSQDKGGYTAAENITVIGGVWDSYKIQNKDKGTEGFRFIHASNITIKNATICNVPDGSHLITLGGVKNAVVENCTLYGYSGKTLKEAIQLDVVHDAAIMPSMQSKILVYDDLPCDQITITGCNIYNYPRAIGSHTSIKGVFHKNIVISGNQLHDLSEAAIKAFNYTNLEISDNKITNTGIGILVYTYINNQYYLNALKTTQKEPLPDNYAIIIKNNTIQNIKEYQSASGPIWGDGIRTIGNAERPLTGVTLANNTIKNTARYGMFLERTNQCSIMDNSVLQTVKNGIYLINGCDFSVIKGNTLTKSGARGSKEGGIGLSASSQVTVSNNTISSPGKNGIFLYHKSMLNSISGNTITSPGDNGIALYHQSNNSEITGNEITNYNRYGIFAYQISSGTINENTINSTKSRKSSDGIHITGDNSSPEIFTLKKNSIQYTDGNGIYIKNAPECYIGGNTITHAKAYGIYVGQDSFNSKIYYNSIIEAGKSGSQKNGIGLYNITQSVLYKNKHK